MPRGPVPVCVLALAAVACAPSTEATDPVPITTTGATSSTTAPPPASTASGPPLRRPYDLEADIRDRTERAHAELGDSAPVRVEAGVFVLVGPRPGRFFDASVKLAHDALQAYFHGRFARPPARAVTVFVFPKEAPYRTFCRQHLAASRWGGAEHCDTALGFYAGVSREIFANLEPGLTTLTHELVHPIVESDFPEAPAWLNEGLGALYEMPVFPRAGEVHGGKNWRLPGLRATLAATRTHDATQLGALFAMSSDDFRTGNVNLHYAVARYLCQWLDAREQLWPFYRAWRDGFLDDPTGETTFARVTGGTPADAQAAWEAWVRGL
jgi:hypothetical protein